MRRGQVFGIERLAARRPSALVRLDRRYTRFLLPLLCTGWGASPANEENSRCREAADNKCVQIAHRLSRRCKLFRNNRQFNPARSDVALRLTPTVMDVAQQRTIRAYTGFTRRSLCSTEAASHCEGGHR